MVTLEDIRCDYVNWIHLGLQTPILYDKSFIDFGPPILTDNIPV